MLSRSNVDVLSYLKNIGRSKEYLWKDKIIQRLFGKKYVK